MRRLLIAFPAPIILIGLLVSFRLTPRSASAAVAPMTLAVRWSSGGGSPQIQASLAGCPSVTITGSGVMSVGGGCGTAGNLITWTIIDNIRHVTYPGTATNVTFHTAYCTSFSPGTQATVWVYYDYTGSSQLANTSCAGQVVPPPSTPTPTPTSAPTPTPTPPPPAFTANGSVMAATVAPGQPESVTVNVLAGSAATTAIQIQIAMGSTVLTTQTYNAQAFSAGGTNSYALTFPAPAAAGTYVVSVTAAGIAVGNVAQFTVS